ncbi:hypothetical protein FQR65_LT16099 [Abscondita terminalis]|nr:hypothetical protein FQR65_LT16099 [Abscondita terminalis]
MDMSKRYFLVRFKEDQILFMCNKKDVRITETGCLVKWSNKQYYDADILLSGSSKKSLEEMYNSLVKKQPVVHLMKHIQNSNCNLDLPQDDLSKQITISQTGHNVPDEVSKNLLVTRTLTFDSSDKECNSDFESSLNNQSDTSRYFCSLVDYDPGLASESFQISSEEIHDVTSIVNGTEGNLDISKANNASIDKLLPSCTINEENDADFDDSIADPNYDPLEDDEYYLGDHTYEDSSKKVLREVTTSVATKNVSSGKDNSKHYSYAHYDRSQICIPNLDEIVTNTPTTINELQITSGSKKDRKYFCIYCKTMYSRIAQHLMVSHQNEEAVKAAMALSPGCIERKRILETIRRNGDYLHNKSLEYNTGKILIARRPKSGGSVPAESILTCPSCKGQFRKTYLRRHYNNCQGQQSKTSVHILSRCISKGLHPDACDMLKQKIFPVLRDDDLPNVITRDIIQMSSVLEKVQGVDDVMNNEDEDEDENGNDDYSDQAIGEENSFDLEKYT